MESFSKGFIKTEINFEVLVKTLPCLLECRLGPDLDDAVVRAAVHEGGRVTALPRGAPLAICEAVGALQGAGDGPAPHPDHAVQEAVTCHLLAQGGHAGAAPACQGLAALTVT